MLAVNTTKLINGLVMTRDTLMPSGKIPGQQARPVGSQFWSLHLNDPFQLPRCQQFLEALPQGALCPAQNLQPYHLRGETGQIASAL